MHLMHGLGVPHFIGDGSEARPVRHRSSLLRHASGPAMRAVPCRQAVEVAWLWSLHEDLHAATQALDELA